MKIGATMIRMMLTSARLEAAGRSAWPSGRPPTMLCGQCCWLVRASEHVLLEFLGYRMLKFRSLGLRVRGFNLKGSTEG